MRKVSLLAVMALSLAACDKPDEPASEGSGTSSGEATTGASMTGDGDGDAPGDGDGEASGDGDGEASGDGDGEASGDGDGEASGDGDGDASGDGDGDASGDGDGDATGDGDGDGSGDGDGDGGSPGDGDGDTSGDGDGDMPAPCEDNDMYEANDDAEQATALDWDNMNPWGSRLQITAHLCPGEDDWYRIPAGMLMQDEHHLHLDGIVMGSSWCGAGCMEPALPAGPENTVAVDIYRAEDMVLINSQERDRGRINMHGSGLDYASDFLVHVRSPTPEASWNYDLYVEVRGYDGEDECEC